MEFEVWILDFGFWIFYFGFWSLDFGFWILDFGLDEALLDIVWILHKIFPCHADSGRRIILNCPDDDVDDDDVDDKGAGGK